MREVILAPIFVLVTALLVSAGSVSAASASPASAAASGRGAAHAVQAKPEKAKKAKKHEKANATKKSKPAKRTKPGSKVPLSKSPVLIGINHTQVDADNWRAPTAIARAENVLRTSTNIQAQAIFGWGTLNPEPSPGQYDWSTLDRRVALMERTTSTPVITLCCSPDWMKGGKVGQTDWSKLEVAPLPSHVGDFAKLAVAVAKRYPKVRNYEVWNELKGYGNSKINNWNIAGYTQLYNAVYDALKKYDPTLHVGGPYVHINVWQAKSAGGFPSSVRGTWGIVDRRDLDAISYWLKHKHGADFIIVDGSSHPRDTASTPDPIGSLGYFTAVDNWLQAHTTLPIWWAEVYVGLPQGVSIQSSQGTRVMSAALTALAESGAHVALLWDPEQYAKAHSPGLFTSTASASGGSPTPLATFMKSLIKVVKHGQPIVTKTSRTWRATNGTASALVNVSGIH